MFVGKNKVKINVDDHVCFVHRLGSCIVPIVLSTECRSQKNNFVIENESKATFGTE